MRVDVDVRVGEIGGVDSDSDSSCACSHIVKYVTYRNSNLALDVV